MHRRDKMTNDWDDDGEFENLANLVIDDSDLQSKDPFDLSKALEGAALETSIQTKNGSYCTLNSNHLETNQKQLKI